MTLAAGQRLGSYEIVGLIGAGGMGEVYRARDTKLKRDVSSGLVSAPVHLLSWTLLWSPESKSNSGRFCEHFGLETRAETASKKRC
jgi:serine/threonine protein kinase